MDTLVSPCSSVIFFSFQDRIHLIECLHIAKNKGNLIWPLQQQLNTSFDDETAALLHDCYSLEEKERLKEEWRLFEEQKRNFERERKNFTEAAIRLGREVLKLFVFVLDMQRMNVIITTFMVMTHLFEPFFALLRKRLFRKTVLLG